MLIGVIYKMAEKINNELYPNCSEMVFRLSGDFEDIRTQMYNIVEWTEGEYSGKYGGGPKEKLHPKINKSIATLREKIKNAITLEDFEQIVIEFTCNYETFFKADGDDLLVATCNNYEWDNVDKEYAEEEYYQVAGSTSYKRHKTIDDYIILKHSYPDDDESDDKPLFIFPDKSFSLKYKDYSPDEVSVVIRKDIAFIIKDNQLIKIDEIKDEDILTKLKILMNLESESKTNK